jgi:tetratricopeptide (TPR) repeat protein
VIAAAARMPPERRESLGVRQALGDSWNALGEAQQRLGFEQEALKAFSQAVEIREAIVQQAGEDREARRKLANAMMNEALAEAALGRVEKSRRQQEEAQRQRRRLLGEDAEDPRLLRDLAQGDFNLARLDLMDSNQVEGLERLRAATERFERLARVYPTDARIWQRYIECLLTLSIFEDGARALESIPPDASPARSHAARAIDYLQPLASLAPENRAYRLRLVELYQQAIEQLLAAGHAAEAERPWLTMQNQLIDRLDPGDTQPDAVRARLMSLRQRALISLGMGRNQEAKVQLQAARDAWHSVKDELTDSGDSGPDWEADWIMLERLIDSL